MHEYDGVDVVSSGAAKEIQKVPMLHELSDDVEGGFTGAHTFQEKQ